MELVIVDVTLRNRRRLNWTKRNVIGMTSVIMSVMKRYTADTNATDKMIKNRIHLNKNDRDIDPPTWMTKSLDEEMSLVC